MLRQTQNLVKTNVDPIFKSKSLKDLSFLSGPVSVTHHENVEGKTFYIFGDEHHTLDGTCRCQEDCREIQRYLELVFKNTTTPIDFFLEYPYLVETMNHHSLRLGSNPNDIMSKIFKQFKVCLNGQTDQCQRKYPKVKFHLTDIRNVIIENNIMTTNFFELYQLLIVNNLSSASFPPGKNQRDLILSLTPANYNKILDNYLKQDNLRVFFRTLIKNSDEIAWTQWIRISRKPWFEHTSEIILETNYLKQASDKLTNSKVKNAFMRFYNELTAELKKRYLEGYNKLKSVNTLAEMKPHLPYIKRVLFATSVFLMDFYTLAMIFSQPGKEVWIYAGEYHAQDYRTFIIKYLGYPNFTGGSPNPQQKRCLRYDLPLPNYQNN